jgi:hypothetical protein
MSEVIIFVFFVVSQTKKWFPCQEEILKTKEKDPVSRSAAQNETCQIFISKMTGFSAFLQHPKNLGNFSIPRHQL